MLIHQEVKKLVELSREIKEFFREMDTDASGHITWEEFKESLQHKKVVGYLEHLGLEVDNARYVFQLLDTHGTGEVHSESFVDGCMRLRGTAKSIDVAIVLFESRKTQLALQELSAKVGRQSKHYSCQE